MQVKSSLLSDIDYNEAEKTLSVTFLKGGTYEYFDVFPETWELFKTANSVGQFFLARIRDKYEYEKK